jgi:DNA-binding NarL/FixJ family response regulator
MTCVVIAETDRSTRNALTLLIKRKYAAKQITYAEDTQSLNWKVNARENCVVLISDKLPGLILPETCEQIRKLNPNSRLMILSVDPLVEALAGKCGAVFIHKGDPIQVVMDQLDKLLSVME